MSRINVVLEDKLEEKLRVAAAKKYGFRKGAISKAISAAIQEWLKSQ